MSTEESERQAGAGSGVRVRDLLEDTLSLAPDAFEKRHGSAFLLMSAAELKNAIGPRPTQVRGLPDSPSDRTAHLRLMIYPVVRTERSIFPFVTVGRTQNNDIVFPEVTISRFHAFFNPGDGGAFTIQDAGSTNGTAVNSKLVPKQQEGPSLPVKSGDSVRFGAVELTFLSAQALREFILEFDID